MAAAAVVRYASSLGGRAGRIGAFGVDSIPCVGDVAETLAEWPRGYFAGRRRAAIFAGAAARFAC